MPIDIKMNKQNVVCTMGYYSALKRKEIWTHAITWKNLEDIMLSEIKPVTKGQNCMIPLT